MSKGKGEIVRRVTKGLAASANIGEVVTDSMKVLPKEAFGDPKAGGKAVSKISKAVAETAIAEEETDRIDLAESAAFHKAALRRSKSAKERESVRQEFRDSMSEFRRQKGEQRQAKASLQRGFGRVADHVAVGVVGLAFVISYIIARSRD